MGELHGCKAGNHLPTDVIVIRVRMAASHIATTGMLEEVAFQNRSSPDGLPKESWLDILGPFAMFLLTLHIVI